jgi:hypothetical protein
MSDFSHLFLALGAGCPPHAGLAIGFDRLIAVMQGRDSVRDVIAFPKDKNGTDLMVKSPSKLSKQRMADYHLVIKDEKRDMIEAAAQEIDARKAASLESLKILLDTIAEWGANSANLEDSTIGQPLIDEQSSEQAASQDNPSQQPTGESTVMGGVATEDTVSEEITIEDFVKEEIESGETIEESLYKDIPRYSPGEVLPYAVMLYNQLGGNFLHETLKGFEILIESLGEEIQKNVRPDKDRRSKGSALKINAERRLKKIHTELMNEILNQMGHITLTYSASGPLKPSEGDMGDLRSELEDAIEPVKILQFSLKAIEPMLETLHKELDKRILEHAIEATKTIG